MAALNVVYLGVGALAAMLAVNSEYVPYQIRPNQDYFSAIARAQPKGVFAKTVDPYKRLPKVSQRVSKVAGPKLQYLRATARKDKKA